MSEIDEDLRHGFKYGICISMALTVFPGTSNQPVIEYYNEYRRINGELKYTSNFLAAQIKERGFDAVTAGQPQNEQFRTPLPFKTLATRAGLGWIGKSATFVTKQYGNAIRLNGVLTNMPLETGTPINSSLCGDCIECVNKCPGKAITGNSWSLHTDRDDLLNANECKNTHIERGKFLNTDENVYSEATCGICIAVCPWTQKYINAQNGMR